MWEIDQMEKKCLDANFCQKWISSVQELGDERNLELKLWFDGAMLEAPFKGSKDFWLKTLKDLTMDSSAGCRPTIGWVLPLVKNNPIGDRHLLMRKVLMCFQYWSWSAAYITRFYHDGLLF